MTESHHNMSEETWREEITWHSVSEPSISLFKYFISLLIKEWTLTVVHVMFNRSNTWCVSFAAHEWVSTYSHIYGPDQHTLITFCHFWKRQEFHDFFPKFSSILPPKAIQLLPRNSQPGLPKMFHFQCLHVFIQLIFFFPHTSANASR